MNTVDSYDTWIHEEQLIYMSAMLISENKMEDLKKNGRKTFLYMEM